MEFESALAKLKNELSSIVSQECQKINNNISSFKTYVGNELSKIKQTVEDMDKRLVKSEEVISNSCERIKALEESTTTNLTKIDEVTNSLESTEASLLKQISNLKQEIASQTDRGMRCTLTFRGIAESDKEGYLKTPKILANQLAHMEAEVRGRNRLTYSDILDSIDRAHRSKKKNEVETPTHQKTPRPIHVKFVTWKDSDYLKSTVIRYNKSLLSKGMEPTVFVDNMYSDHTNERRKRAWDKLKILRNEGVKAPMYVKYPATLVIKNENTGKYEDHTIF